jgi:hypothetical protein
MKAKENLQLLQFIQNRMKSRPISAIRIDTFWMLVFVIDGLKEANNNFGFQKDRNLQRWIFYLAVVWNTLFEQTERNGTERNTVRGTSSRNNQFGKVWVYTSDQIKYLLYFCKVTNGAHIEAYYWCQNIMRVFPYVIQKYSVYVLRIISVSMKWPVSRRPCVTAHTGPFIICDTFEIMSKQVGSPLFRSSLGINLEVLLWKSVSRSSLEPERSKIFRKRNRLRSAPFSTAGLTI